MLGVRQRDLDDFRTERFVVPDRGTHGGVHLRVNAADEILARHAELHTFQILAELRGVVWHGLFEARGIERVAAGDGVQHQRGVLDGFCKRADLIERRCKCDKSETRDAAVRGLQPHTSAQRGGLADGSAGVRAERSEGFICGDDRSGPAGRAAGYTRGIPRIA